ncbi:MAG: hypothetical protein U0796_14420 [Gemmatales bacterium]
MSQSNGALFYVCFAESLRRKLRDWAMLAGEQGLRERLLQAYRKMSSILVHDPFSGEPAYQLPQMQVTVYRLSFDFLTVYYAIDDKRHIVFVKDVLSSIFGELPENE